jgi:hypothetical protein
MQFFIFDFALAFAALLGYRALIAVLRHRAAVVSVGAGITRSPEFIQRRRAVRLRASIHRLINFW